MARAKKVREEARKQISMPATLAIQNKLANAGKRSAAKILNATPEQKSAWDLSYEQSRAGLDPRKLGSPSVKKGCTQAWERFTAFQQKREQTGIPNIEDICRFCHFLIRDIEPKKVASLPSSRTVLNIMKSLMAVLAFLYPSAINSVELKERVHKEIKCAVFDQVLTKEPIFERSWVGSDLITQFVTKTLYDAASNGTRSWSVTIQKALSLVLLSATAARAGDIVLSEGYAAEYLTWAGVRFVYSSAHSHMLEHLKCNITLGHTKGHK